MKTFRCQCSSPLFFNNTSCVSCELQVGLCAVCRQVAAFECNAERFTCTNCSSELKLCQNQSQHQACNGSVSFDAQELLCKYCRLNRTIPDLNIAENALKWRRLERAKHRVLYGCESIGLPIQDDDPPTGQPPLRFDFKSSQVEPVLTGHADGVITIEVGEADSVKREQTRVLFGEPQRTLVGHFRHELGHYYWQRLVEPACLAEYREVFGDERDPGYGEAKDQYYQSGPPADWRLRFISQYAAMHSWEDFAETFNAYLDMLSVVGTSAELAPALAKLPESSSDGTRSLDDLLAAYTRIGILANELNRDMGLLDLVPEVFAPAINTKLRFVHELVARTAQVPTPACMGS